ncbi:MAG: hypothetical protein AB7Q81_24485 [Gammaproteobacteria bacterium]|uniref:hypothetical protein n=1 Tax=Piscinibacter sp. TaxID=1903157 RepID=UPI003D13DD7B
MFDTCRVCHCDELHACDMGDGTPCWWVEPDLCSACADAEALADLCQADVDGLDTLAIERFALGEVI